MKNVILLYAFLVLGLLVAVSSCSDDDTSSFQLDKSSITFSEHGGIESVQLTVGEEWEIRNIPFWLTVNPSSGKSSATITFTAAMNKESRRRKVSLTFVSQGVSKVLQVEQASITD